MSIIDRSQLSLARLNKILGARQEVDEAKSLEGLRFELVKLATPVNNCASNAMLLKRHGVHLSSVPEIGALIETVNRILIRFEEMPKSTTLRQGGRWTGLTTKLEALSTKLSEMQSDDWKTHFSGNYFGGLSPTQREANLILAIPGNKEALDRYRLLYQKYIKFRSNIPKDDDEFIILGEVADQLAGIHFEENDIPDDVRRFFEATNAGASLELLTVEVIEWLRSNNLLNRYVVRAKLN